MVRVPKIPTQKKREEHEATHLPHAEWCEACIKGRARNRPHKRRSQDESAAANQKEEGVHEGMVADDDNLLSAKRL